MLILVAEGFIIQIEQVQVLIQALQEDQQLLEHLYQTQQAGLHHLVQEEVLTLITHHQVVEVHHLITIGHHRQEVLAILLVEAVHLVLVQLQGHHQVVVEVVLVAVVEALVLLVVDVVKSIKKNKIL